MTDVSAGSLGSIKGRSDSNEDTLLTTLLSGSLIIGLPAAFWISVFELANYMFGLGLSSNFRLIVAASLIGMLGLIWSFIVVSARQRRARQEAMALYHGQTQPAH